MDRESGDLEPQVHGERRVALKTRPANVRARADTWLRIIAAIGTLGMPPTWLQPFQREPNRDATPLLRLYDAGFRVASALLRGVAGGR
jgi:hypothetical protein